MIANPFQRFRSRGFYTALSNSGDMFSWYEIFRGNLPVPDHEITRVSYVPVVEP